MSRKVSVPHHGFINVAVRPTDDAAEVLLAVGAFKLHLTPGRARRIADLLHDISDLIESQEHDHD